MSRHACTRAIPRPDRAPHSLSLPPKSTSATNTTLLMTISHVVIDQYRFRPQGAPTSAECEWPGCGKRLASIVWTPFGTTQARDFAASHLTRALLVPIFVQANMAAVKSISHVDLMFRAFSDRTRLRILPLLSPGELCVCDLVR